MTNLADALVGAWRLERWTIDCPGTDRVTRPFGPKPQGLLVHAPVDGTSTTKTWCTPWTMR